MTLEASCSNCVSWTRTPEDGHATSAGQGFCGVARAPDVGALLCQSHYRPTPAFKQEIISSMLKDHGPMAMPVKLMGGRKSARAQNRKLRGR